MARYCARNRVGPEDVGEVEWNLAPVRADEMEVWPSLVLGKRKGGDALRLARRGGGGDLSSGPSGTSMNGNRGSVASSPSSSVRVPSWPS